MTIGGDSAALAPLRGVRVLDLTVALSGPMMTLLLAQLGAEVVRVEPPGGRELGRFNPPFLGSRGLHFDSPTEDDVAVSILNRMQNKRSVTIDLKSERGRELFLQMAATADVVAQNFSDGTATRLGVDYDCVRSVNPAIVYCSISGFGQNGGRDGVKAMDIIVQALSGVMAVTGEPEGPPTRTGIPIADMMASVYAAVGVLAALRARDQHGHGQHVDVSMLDCLTALVAEEHFDVLSQFGFPDRAGNFHHRLAPFGAFRCLDGSVAIAATADGWTRSTFIAMGRPDLVNDSRFATRGQRVLNGVELADAIEGWTSTLPVQKVVDALVAHGVPCGRVRTPAEAIRDQRVLDRGAVTTLLHPTVETRDNPIYGMGLPIVLSASSRVEQQAASHLGADTARVLGEWIGVTNDEIEALREARVI